MTTLETKGLLGSPEKLIDEVFRLKARNAHPRAIKRMCGISITDISDILKNETPSVTIQKEILQIKINTGEHAGQNMDHLSEDMDELNRLEKSESKKANKSTLTNKEKNKNASTLSL